MLLRKAVWNSRAAQECAQRVGASRSNENNQKRKSLKTREQELSAASAKSLRLKSWWKKPHAEKVWACRAKDRHQTQQTFLLRAKNKIFSSANILRESREWFARSAQINFLSSHKQSNIFRKVFHFQLAKLIPRLPTNLVHTKAIVTKRCHNNVVGNAFSSKKFLLKRLIFRAKHLRATRKTFQKINLRDSRKIFARENNFFCAFSKNVCCVWWWSFARQARIFSAWGFFYHLFKRKFFELAALNFCAHVFKDLRVQFFLFERLALTLCAHSCAASAHHRCVATHFESWLSHLAKCHLKLFVILFSDL